MSTDTLVSVPTLHGGVVTVRMAPTPEALRLSKMFPKQQSTVTGFGDIITLDDATEYLTTLGVSKRMVTVMWSGLVRSGVFEQKCSKHGPRSPFCGHASQLQFAAADLRNHMDEFVTTATTGSGIPGIGDVSIAVAMRFVDELRPSTS